MSYVQNYRHDDIKNRLCILTICCFCSTLRHKSYNSINLIHGRKTKIGNIGKPLLLNVYKYKQGVIKKERVNTTTYFPLPAPPSISSCISFVEDTL